MVFPPFFRWSRTGDLKALNCPWPFVQYSSGETDKLYLWPLWGRRSSSGFNSTFLLWPIIRSETTEKDDLVTRRFKCVPVISYESRPPEHRYFKLWPLFSYRREEDIARTRALALWPRKETPGIERNYAPLWTLYSRTRSGALREDDLLWGLFRYRRQLETKGDPQSKELSALFGLVRYEREGLRRQFRLLYFINVPMLSSDDN